MGTKAPAVTIADLDGKPVDLGSVLGKKPVLLEFWATWCSLCKALLPQLEAIRKTVSSVIGVRVAMSAIPRAANPSRRPCRTTPTAKPTAG